LWSGSCTFATAGVYTFYCTVHGAAMSGTITVGAQETTTTTTTTGAPPPGQTGTATGTTTHPPYPEQPAGGSQSPLPLHAGPELSALRVLAVVHGHWLSGSLDLSGAGSGAMLRIDVLASRSALSEGPGHSLVAVGHLKRAGLGAGVDRFQVRLSATALRALRLHGHLTVRVSVSLSTPGGASPHLTRTIHLTG
jgi:hypothetical protein